jgi:CoA-transferase family III
MNPNHSLEQIWRESKMPVDALNQLTLTGADPVLASSFAIGQAAQCSVASAALAAVQIGACRGALLRKVSVDMTHAALECNGHFSLDGTVSQLWDPLSGLYRCRNDREGKAQWIRLHTNFAHHRDGILRLLGLPLDQSTNRQLVAQATANWEAEQLEKQASAAGLVVAAARSFEQWDAHPHANFVSSLPLISIEKIADANPLTWPQLAPQSPPLAGLKMLDLTRILAGPVCGRTLANYGADVMLINSPQLPNIASIADTSRGKRSAHLNLKQVEGRAGLNQLLRDAHIFVQGYRPGALASVGFDPVSVAKQRPGIIYVSLSAYGENGPWANKRGFDSLVQTATGFNIAEAHAAGEVSPKAMPVQILDYATGFLMAFGAQAALYRQQTEGGSWHVQVSLARTGCWLRTLGRIENGLSAKPNAIDAMLESSDSGFGRLVAMRHSAKIEGLEFAANGLKPSMPPGSHPPVW